MATTTVSINADYLTLVRRYSELSGASAKAAIEYAIDQVLTTEIEEYLKYDDDTEVEQLTAAANALLPESWHFDVCAFGHPQPKNMVGLNLGLDGIVPTYITPCEAQIVRNSLDYLPNSGGSFYFGGEHMGAPVFVRRQGQGIIFKLLDKSTGQPTGAKTTISRTSVPRITMALDSIIRAARSSDEPAK